MKTALNSISLEGSQDSSDPYDGRIPVVRYMVIDKDGQSDELRYSTWYKAVDAVIDSDRGVEREVEAGVYSSDDRNDWLYENGEEILKDFGYRVISILIWKE